MAMPALKIANTGTRPVRVTYAIGRPTSAATAWTVSTTARSAASVLAESDSAYLAVSACTVLVPQGQAGRPRASGDRGSSPTP